MAKALLGHVGRGSDLRLHYELGRLRDRVSLLEKENARLRAANRSLADGLAADDERLALTVLDTVSVSTSESIDDREPALT
ncbi:MAG TPA: hypothetical protein VHW92_03545 [Mycobacteriales bacterium]|jgi:hypothetical protein|nr:hypothetical protein [Mycobacteriales bacterium]